MRRFETARTRLIENLGQAQRITNGRDGPASDAIPDEWLTSRGLQLFRFRQQEIVQLRPHGRVDDGDLGAHQVIEQQVALYVVVVVGAREVKVAFEAELVARGCGLAAIIRLYAGAPDKHLGLLL